MPRKTKDVKRNNKQSKGNKKTSSYIKENNVDKNEKFSFDDEIVIGLRRIDKPKSENKTNKISKQKLSKNKKQKKLVKSKYKEQKKKNNDKKLLEKRTPVIKDKQLREYQEIDININRETNISKGVNNKKRKSNKKQKVILKVIKWITLLGIIIGGIVYAMLSPIFNISEIIVNGNEKISSETIVSLSKLSINQNIFKFSTSNTIEAIKENAYIDKVEIKRELPNKVEITVYERKPTLILTYGSSYVYINNQGYILEIKNKKEDYPIIEGYKTPNEQIEAGNRLIEEDLKKLEDVLKILEATKSVENNLYDKITKIDISDKSNYIIIMDKEKKKVYLGDTTNLSTKMLWINEFLNSEKKNEGTIYLNVNLNTEEPYFREKV